MTRSLVLHLMQYNQLTYDHPAITTLLLEDLVLEKQFDIALSLSRYVRRDNIDWSSTASPLDVHICTTHLSHPSFDHDGLGRYGDRLHPEGDLLAMRTVAAVLKDQGLLFLTVPIGRQ